MTQRAADLLERIARGVTLRRELEALEAETAEEFDALDGCEQLEVCRQLGLEPRGSRGRSQPTERIEA